MTPLGESLRTNVFIDALRLCTRQDGVIEVHLLRRDAGSIGGVRVGDAEAEVRARWGAPTEAESIDAGEETSYIAGKWMVVVVYDTVTRRVKELWLGPPSDRD